MRSTQGYLASKRYEPSRLLPSGKGAPNIQHPDRLFQTGREKLGRAAGCENHGGEKPGLLFGLRSSGGP